MQCEQILAGGSILGAESVTKALAPYCSYGSGLMQVEANRGNAINGNSVASTSQENHLPPSPSSLVRRLALRVLSHCIPHLTSRQLISALPLLMSHVLPSFRSPLVDIRQAVVTAIVQMYILVGDVLHPYVKELPPQQKKLLTIYIDRQLKTKGNKSIISGKE
jgi:hypothetical protein